MIYNFLIMLIFLLFVATEAITVRKNIPKAPTYTLTASDVVCSGHMVKVFDANDGTYNPGLSTASEADECAEACRTRSDASSTSLYQWGTSISDGSWMKRTVGSPEDGECHCTFSDTTCVPYTDVFPFYDKYTLNTMDYICQAETSSEVIGNYVRSDCSCEYGFAGNLCLDPRMTCILSGTEAPDGESCRCTDERMSDTEGCCPVGTVYASNKYSSYTPFQSLSPMPDTDYYKSAFHDLCNPHEGISQNESSSPQTKSQSVLNYAMDASEMRVIGPADDCSNAPSVDFLYDYEYSMQGYCGNGGIAVYNTNNPGISHEDQERYCFEACIGKYAPTDEPLNSQSAPFPRINDKSGANAWNVDYNLNSWTYVVSGANANEAYDNCYAVCLNSDDGFFKAFGMWKSNAPNDNYSCNCLLNTVTTFTSFNSMYLYYGELLYDFNDGTYTNLKIHGFTIKENGKCICNHYEQMIPNSECSSFINDGKTFRIISAPMGCLEVDALQINRVMNVGKSHLYTWDTKSRPMVMGSPFESQKTIEYPIHSWGGDEEIKTSIKLMHEITTVHCKKDLFATYEDWIRCAARSCQGLSRGGYSMKRMLITSNEVRCFTDSQGRYGKNDPKTAKQIQEPWRFNIPDEDCTGHIISVGIHLTAAHCMQSCIDGLPSPGWSGTQDDVMNNLNFFTEGRVTKYFAHNKETSECLCYDYVPNQDAPDACIKNTFYVI